MGQSTLTLCPHPQEQAVWLYKGFNSPLLLHTWAPHFRGEPRPIVAGQHGNAVAGGVPLLGLG